MRKSVSVGVVAALLIGAAALLFWNPGGKSGPADPGASAKTFEAANNEEVVSDGFEDLDDPSGGLMNVEDIDPVFDESIPSRDQIVAELTASMSPEDAAKIVGASNLVLVRAPDGSLQTRFILEACEVEENCVDRIVDSKTGEAIFDGEWSAGVFKSSFSPLVAIID